MTRPARRHGRSRRATRECAAAAAPTRSRATGRGTPTRTARRVTRVRSSGGGRATEPSKRCSRGGDSTVGCLPPTTGRARTPGAGTRSARAPAQEGDWPSASVVSKLYGNWAAARDAAAQAVRDATEHQRNTDSKTCRNLRTSVQTGSGQNTCKCTDSGTHALHS